jgi:hypothetical protein
LFAFTGLTGFGRTVPERILTVQERKLKRQERKAAKETPTEVPAGAPPLADPSMPERDDDLLVAAAAARSQTARDNFGPGEPAAIRATGAAAEPLESEIPQATTEAAADAKAKRKKQKRQMKKRKKKERKRLAAAANQADTAEAPEVQTDGTASRPTVAATVLGARDPVAQSEPASVGAQRPAS